MRFAPQVLAVSTLMATLAGCGGGGSPTQPAPVPTPAPAPVTTIVSEGSHSGLGERHLVMIPFRTSSGGTIRATVDWTFTASTIYVYMSQGTCTIEEINGRICRFVAVSEAAVPKPRQLTVPGAVAGEYVLYIGNFAGAEESVSWQVAVTTSTASLPPGVSAASASQPRAAGVTWRR